MLVTSYCLRIMDVIPWITITHTRDNSDLQVHPHVFSDLPLAKATTPQLVVLIGKHEKSNVLRELLPPDTQYPLVPHGQVYLWPDPATRLTDTPTIFVDCELHSPNSTQQRDPVSYIAPELSTKIAGLPYGDQVQTGARFTVNVLLPISTILYYFASDFGGTNEIARLLATQLSIPFHVETPQAVLPRIVVVTDRDDEDALQDFIELLVLALKAGNYQQSESEARATIAKRFGTLQTISLGHSNKFERSKVIRAHISKTLASTVVIRSAACYLFTFDHLQAFIVILLENFCSEATEHFSLIKASRSRGFHADEFVTHLKNLLEILPSEAWLWHFVSPMVASCLLLALYPPSSHRLFVLTISSIHC